MARSIRRQAESGKETAGKTDWRAQYTVVTVAPPLGRGTATNSYVQELKRLGVPEKELSPLRARVRD